MREFTVSLTYDGGASDLMDTLAAHPRLRTRSEACFATTEHMWRLDRLTGPEGPLAELEARYLDPDRCNECLDDETCETHREYAVLEREPTSRLVYTRRYEVDGCRSVPYFAADELCDGVLFEASRRESTYTWRILMPSAENAGALFDRLEETLSDAVGLELEHCCEPRGWTGTRSVTDRLSPEQRHALETAVDRGYYGSPRAVTLAELADAVDVPRSTLQYRLRRAEQAVLSAVVSRERSAAPS